MARNCHARIMDNNFNDSSVATITYSSQLSALYAASNTRDTMRSKVWKPSGYFRIKTSNCKLYINDGSAKTATLTPGAYTTAAALATHIQSVLNAVSSGWTVSYSSTTYKFTISRSSSATLVFSSTTDAVWDVLGYTATADDATGPWPAQESRIHTREFYQIDLGLAYSCPAFHAICPIDESFPLSSTATVVIKADNIDDEDNWESPAFTHTCTPGDNGIHEFMDDADGTSRTYRYWRFEYVDRMNPAGPSTFGISHIYFGDWVTMSISNVSPGFTYAFTDRTEASESESGQQFFKSGSKYRRFQSLSIELMDADERRELVRTFERLGTEEPFYLALDPTLEISETTGELTAFGRFATEPTLPHVIRDLFTVNIDFREAC